MINFRQLSISGIVLIEPQIFNDDRGFFFESFNQKEFEKVINRKVNFVQDNHSRSSKGVLRGLHYQKAPHEQGKLVRVSHGEVFDVAVDLRKNSITYGQWVAEILTAENKKVLWIPEGFAHGFLVLSDKADFLYKTTKYYEPDSEITIKWDDVNLNIDWPDIKKIISEKDKKGISFFDSKKIII